MEIKKEFKGSVGLFLVCAELSKQNLIAMPTSRNTKSYDIIVLNPDTNRSIGIQVKCSDRKEFLIFSSHWKNYKKKIDERITCPFVFVDISDINNPPYYILTKDEVKSLIKNVIERYIEEYQKKHHTTFKDMLEMEEKAKRRVDLWVLKLSDVEKYKDRWRSIIDLLE